MSKPNVTKTGDGRRRVVLEAISPSIDDGRFPCKRAAGDRVTVEIDAFTDGHDRLSCLLLHRGDDERDWSEVDMTPLGNDRWRGEFRADRPGSHHYKVSAWVDHFKTWRHDLGRREDPDDVALALREGATLLLAAAKSARGDDAARLRESAEQLVGGDSLQTRCELALAAATAALMARYGSRELASEHPQRTVYVDDQRGRFSSWYELFPRSCAPQPGRHGTLADVEALLPYVAEMGFDVLYLPPIHPIGERHRKGANNALTARRGEPGVPWAVGSAHGGHKSIHPELGDAADFRRLVAAAAERGIDVALDIALQCSPDHPYVSEHPRWFKQRPDGSVQYAENPPKKYQDIYPFDFECGDWKNLWAELKSIFDHWLGEGVRVFRVDNPHTKPFRFWEWLIAEVRRQRPDAIFLAEAFTRPKVMHRLAKLGFNQSYTYFTWRNDKTELEAYLLEVSRPPGSEYFRANFWPNTPDILHETLQTGGLAASRLRLLLAATMSASYGIYGPTFELGEVTPREPGSEEYLDSEKYQIRHWNRYAPHSLSGLISRVNRIRRDNAALQHQHGVSVHRVDNERLICYSKRSPDDGNVILTVVNLDPRWPQSGWTALDLSALGLDAEQTFRADDLLSGESYLWRGARNYVELHPQRLPGHVFRIEAEH